MDTEISAHNRNFCFLSQNRAKIFPRWLPVELPEVNP